MEDTAKFPRLADSLLDDSGWYRLILDSHPWAYLGSLRDKGVTQGADTLSSKWPSLILH